MSQTTRKHAAMLPPMPPIDSPVRTNVHGTVFAARIDVISRLQPGDRLLLVPDPLQENETPSVWVHVSGGDVLGHVPVQVAAWLAPWMLAGARCRATVVQVRGPEVESWNRIEIELDRSPPS